ncbi:MULTISPECIES: hybrid sensor histidine kinase/response regulator [unclassified Desulfurobacterium]|uniref:hybrid sensor histidine kinase/response regulator n=1 Tax=Desulfurobacterium sp. TC5-1 TaxID=1158318 RepID=UPI0003B48DC7|nr:ATP-binding protein [Desulfurobacterium sp. TC5-1]
MKIRTKFILLLSVMGFFGFLASTTGMYSMHIHEKVDEKIEAVSTERYLLERMLLDYTMGFVEGFKGHEKQDLKRTMAIFDKNLKALGEGGVFIHFTGLRHEASLEEKFVVDGGLLKEKNYSQELKVVNEVWSKLKKDLLSGKVPPEVLLKEAAPLKEAFGLIVDKLKKSNERRLFYKLEGIYIVIGTLVFLLIAMMLRDVSYRLNKLTRAISSIPSGLVCKLSSIPEKYKTDDEIGEAFKASEDTAKLIFTLLGRIKFMLQNFQSGRIEKIRIDDLEGKWKDIGELLNAISDKWAEAAQATLRWIECFKGLRSCETCENRFNCVIPADNRGIYKQIYGTLKRLKDETMVAADEIERFREEVSKAIREGKSYIPSTIDYSKIPEFLIHIARSLEDMAIYLINALSSQKIFLATVSHDIRTPLNGIIGFLNLLSQSDKLSEKDKEYVELALSSAKQLLSLVNDILDVAKIQAEQIELYTEPLNIIKVLKETAYAISSNLKKGVKLRFNFPEEEIWVVADEKRIKQIFFNLLSNAAKFTERGYIEVGLKKKKDEGEVVKLLFYVKDTGIGIPYEKQPLLFRPFSQVKSHISKKVEGTGLGLFITKKLANIMGGDVWVESVPGKGSTFYVLLSLKKTKAPAKQSAVKSVKCRKADKNLKVLVAEDVLVNQIFIRELLRKKFGIEHVRIVDNGEKAVEEAEKNNYDIILMDLKMPVMDGLTAVKEIRKKGIDVPIFILTADAFRDSEEKAMKAGADGYLVKPIEFEQLCKALTYATNYKMRKEKG